MGSFFGVLPQLIVAARATRLTLSLAGAWVFLAMLVSLVSVPVIRGARKAYDPGMLSSFGGEMLSLTRLPVFRYMAVYRFIEGFVTSIVVNGALYHMTLVD